LCYRDVSTIDPNAGKFWLYLSGADTITTAKPCGHGYQTKGHNDKRHREEVPTPKTAGGKKRFVFSEYPQRVTTPHPVPNQPIGLRHSLLDRTLHSVRNSYIRSKSGNEGSKE
jgi:hypothetical protein